MDYGFGLQMRAGRGFLIEQPEMNKNLDCCIQKVKMFCLTGYIGMLMLRAG